MGRFSSRLSMIVNNNTTINGIKAKNIKTLILPAAPKYNNKNIADYVKSFVQQIEKSLI